MSPILSHYPPESRGPLSWPVRCLTRQAAQIRSVVVGTLTRTGLKNETCPTQPAGPTQSIQSTQSMYAVLQERLNVRGIQAKATNGTLPPEAAMHDLAAPVPVLVISPQSEWGVIETLKLFKALGLYSGSGPPISVKSGGHGYFNGASCSGIMLNLGGMAKGQVHGDTLVLQPGCILGQTISILADHHKAVPHGDCFGVGAGGHFLTAGWDIVLARRYGLGCQSVVGGRIALWDGEVVDVNEVDFPDLLYAMRGGAAAEVGVVTEIRLGLIEEPPHVSWRFTRITKAQLELCVANQTFAKAYKLPRDISVSFRFHFDDQPDPVCSFNVCSLLPAQETARHLRVCLGQEVAEIVMDLAQWKEQSLRDLRMLPASDALVANPDMLREMTPAKLHDDPLIYWGESHVLREMGRSFFASRSHWVVPACDSMLPAVYEAFRSIRETPARRRMYALLVQGGGEMTQRQPQCAMSLGEALFRFEVHNDHGMDDPLCSRIVDTLTAIVRPVEDTKPGRPYRGDIWLAEQAKDVTLDRIAEQYNRR